MKSTQRFRFSTLASSVALRIFVAFFVIYAITSSGGLEASDSEVRYDTAKSWLAGMGGELQPDDEAKGVAGRGGRYYSYYGPFQSILMLPVVAAINRFAPSHLDQLFKLVFGIVVIPAVSALSLAVLFCALRTLRFGERDAFLTVAFVGLATPLWHYGRSGQEENITGLAFAIYLCGMGRLFLDRFSGLLLIALASSVIVASRWAYLPALLILLIPVGLLLWQKRADWRRFWPSLSVSAAFGGAVVAAVLWYNVHRFGRPFETGYGLYYSLVRPPLFTWGDAPNHFVALAISPYRGLLWFFPAILVLLGLRNAPKGSFDGRLWKATLGAWLFTWLFISSIAFWDAGDAWGPRYFVGMVVLLAPGFAAVFASGQRWRAVIAISLAVQFCSTLLPSSSEDFAFDTMNRERPGTCTPWVCECNAPCLRLPWALRAIGNTLSSRELPVIELTSAVKTPGGISPLQTSDFNSVYWWPVRAAYRAHRINPALAFSLCLLVLSAACSALWFFYRRLPGPSPQPVATPGL